MLTVFDHVTYLSKMNKRVPTSFSRFVLISYLCGLLLILLSLTSLAADQEQVPRLPLALQVFLKNPRYQVYELHVHLTNVSQSTVKVNIRDLPWNPPNDSKWFTAVRLDEKLTLVTQQIQDWNLGSRLVTLLPGESIQDTMLLNLRMPSLLDDIAQFGVQLQWDCPPASLKFVCKDNSLQNLTIPQGDPGQPDIYSIDKHRCQKMAQAIGLINIPEGHPVLFLLMPESVMGNVQSVQVRLYQVDDYVRHCQPTWTNSWAVSFFTDDRYAGFLSDRQRRADFQQGIWQKVNIGQYSSQTRTLNRFPWIKDRADSVYLSVHRSQ